MRRIACSIPWVVLICSLVPVAAVEFPVRQLPADFDLRLDERGAAPREPTAEQRALADALRRTVPGLVLRWDGSSGSPKWIAAPAGAGLSAPAPGSPEAIARDYLADHAELFGLDAAAIHDLLLTSMVPAAGGGAHAYFTQRAGDLDVYGGRATVTVAADGTVRSVASRLWREIEPDVEPTLDAAAAAAIAARDVYPDRALRGAVKTQALEAADRKTVFDEPELGRGPEARLVVYPGPNGARLAWEVRLAEPGFETDYRILVDAADGTLLARHNLTRYAEGRVLRIKSPDPEGAEYEQSEHRVVEFPASTPESPTGWISGAGTTLAGNNAVSHLGLVVQPGLSSPTASYDFAFNTNESALLNAWYWVNDAHDRFYAAGFDEAAGNFQQDNFAGGGVGGDPVQVVAWHSTSHMYFTSTVDGQAPQLFFGWLRWFNYRIGGCLGCEDHDGFPENGGDRSAGYMRDYLYHEYAHGVTGRRVGGPADDGCLTGLQPGKMAEAWSDVFAASFLDDPSIGDYHTQSNGFKRDLRHDLGIADLADHTYFGNYVWGGTLWDLRQSMRALDPSGGVEDFHRLIVEALAVGPCEPSFLDGRDAILAADTLLFASAHHPAIWNVFTSRGMGELATTVDENDDEPVADETVPAGFECPPPAVPSGLTATVDGANAVRLDYSATGAASIEIWREDLDNPADAPERIAFTTDASSWLDTTVQGGKSYRYHVVALGGGGVVCRSGDSPTADATATGTCDLEFPLFVPDVGFTDGDPSCELTLSWSPASEACPGSGEPIVYNVYRGITPGFLPGDGVLVARTASTSYSEVPPEPIDPGFHNWFHNNWHYLVLAQHGTLDDPPDHRDRGSAQVLQWRSAMPTLGRTTVHYWDFDSGPQGWTAQDLGGSGSEYAWTVVEPIGTHYGGTLRAPDEAAGGSGMAWVTGDPGVPPESIFANNCSELHLLTSPQWDATDGATIVSFDYWASQPYYGELYASMWLCVGPSADPCSREIGLQTTQAFNGPGRYGWQHFELDIADLLASDGTAPRVDQTIGFAGADCDRAEYGIDNVRVERATVCSRSDLKLASVAVDDTAPGWGNGNGVLDPGEIAAVRVQLLNEGGTTAVAPTGTIAARAGAASVLDGVAGLPDIAPGSTADSAGDDFVVALSGDLACYGTTVFELVFTDASGARATALWSPELGRVVTDVLFQDDFETDQGWISTGAAPYEGPWERGDPEGTTVGADQANPEDCADGPGTLCYVTGLFHGGSATKNDVDPGTLPMLTSPAVGVDGYKRVRFGFDAWKYDEQDCCENWMGWNVLTDDETVVIGNAHNYSNSFWRPFELALPLYPLTPVGTDLRLSFLISDGEQEHIVEGAVDNVIVEGDRQVCDPNAIQPPNPVGPTLRLDKSGANAVLTWVAPPVDASHDAAVYYDVLVWTPTSGGFGAGPTPMTTAANRPLAAPTEYYVVGATNGGGTSGEAP